MTVINKKILAKTVKNNVDIDEHKCESVINELFKAIESYLQEGHTVNITGFGKFETIKRAARETRHPRTREPVTIESKRSPKFKASDKLKTSIAS